MAQPPHLGRSAADRMVGYNIFRLRNRLGFSRADLAAETGLTPRYLEQIEAGTTRPNATVLLQLAMLLHCSLSDFFRPLPADPAGAGPEPEGNREESH